MKMKWNNTNQNKVFIENVITSFIQNAWMKQYELYVIVYPKLYKYQKGYTYKF